MARKSRWQSLRIRAGLIIFGIALGWLAKSILGDPAAPQSQPVFKPIPEELREELQSLRLQGRVSPMLDNIGEPEIDDFSWLPPDFPPIHVRPPDLPGSRK